MRKYPKIAHMDLSLEVNPDTQFSIVEKLDGSQFRMSIEGGELLFGSKETERDIDKMFDLAIEQATKGFKRMLEKTCKCEASRYEGFVFFFEFLAKPKHNTIKYGRAPKNNLVLFDIYSPERGYLPREIIEHMAEQMEVEPETTIVTMAWKDITADKIKALLETDSVLGEAKIEGIVLKDRTAKILDSNRKQYEPMYMKYVSEAFKEKNHAEWKDKIKLDIVDELIKVHKTEARWNKAIQHLKEKGLLEKQPRDIPKLVAEVMRDVEEEEKENIKEALWNHYKRKILSNLIHGLPEFYKEKLMKGEV